MNIDTLTLKNRIAPSYIFFLFSIFFVLSSNVNAKDFINIEKGSSQSIFGPYNPFIIKVRTYNYGKTNKYQFEIPTNTERSYKYNVDCDSDGNIEATNLTGNYICQYDNPGNYSISISGKFPQIYFGEPGAPYAQTTKDNLKLLSVDNWGSIEWKSMKYTFYGCENLKIYAKDKPDLSRVTSMRGMFAGATSFNQYIGDWNVQNITDMSQLFMNAISFNKNIGYWNVGKVTNFMEIFSNASVFNQDIGNWDVSNAVYMNYMFYKAHSFNQDIGNWDVRNVQLMIAMFREATSFDQDISEWNIKNLNSLIFMFVDAGLSINNYDRLLIGWSRLQPNNSQVLHAGNSNYSKAGSAARNDLITEQGWVIFDGGFAWWLYYFKISF